MWICCHCGSMSNTRLSRSRAGRARNSLKTPRFYAPDHRKKCCWRYGITVTETLFWKFLLFFCWTVTENLLSIFLVFLCKTLTENLFCIFLVFLCKMVTEFLSRIFLVFLCETATEYSFCMFFVFFNPPGTKGFGTHTKHQGGGGGPKGPPSISRTRNTTNLKPLEGLGVSFKVSKNFKLV